jgi:hypothetical protein
VLTALSRPELRVSGDVFRQKLQGDKSTKLGVFCLIYNTHTAATESLDNAVVRYGLADHLDTTRPLAR